MLVLAVAAVGLRLRLARLARYPERIGARRVAQSARSERRPSEVLAPISTAFGSVPGAQL